MILLAGSEGPAETADAQADLGLHCRHIPKDKFSHGVADKFWVLIGISLRLIIHLTLCMLGNFACFLSVDFFLNLLFQKKICQEYHQTVKQFGSRSGPTFCRA